MKKFEAEMVFRLGVDATLADNFWLIFVPETILFVFLSTNDVMVAYLGVSVAIGVS